MALILTLCDLLPQGKAERLQFMSSETADATSLTEKMSKLIVANGSKLIELDRYTTKVLCGGEKRSPLLC